VPVHPQIVACTPGRMIDLLVTSGGALFKPLGSNCAI